MAMYGCVAAVRERGLGLRRMLKADPVCDALRR